MTSKPEYGTRYRATAKGKRTARKYRRRYLLTPKGIARRKKKLKAHRTSRVALIQAIKNVPCADCGGKFDPVCMDFDHRPGEIKVGNIARLATRSMNLETLRREIAKCDIVCANCHRLRTKNRGWNSRPAAAPLPPQLDLLTIVDAGSKPMSCHGQGICGCGRDECTDAAWWFAFLGFWALLAFELTEIDPRHVARRDDAEWLRRIEQSGRLAS